MKLLLLVFVTVGIFFFTSAKRKRGPLDYENTEVSILGRTVMDIWGPKPNTRTIHDFYGNVTGFVVLDKTACYLMPLNKSAIVPPDVVSPTDSIQRIMNGDYNVDLDETLQHWEPVTPALNNTYVASLSETVADKCKELSLPVYKLERIPSENEVPTQLSTSQAPPRISTQEGNDFDLSDEFESSTRGKPTPDDRTQEPDLHKYDSDETTVPSFSGAASSRFIHDWSANLTGIVDFEQQICYIMPLNRSVIVEPKDLLDAMQHMIAGDYTLEPKEVRENWRVVTPALSSAYIASRSELISSECAAFTSYKLEKIVSGVFKRSLDMLPITYRETVGSTSYEAVVYF